MKSRADHLKIHHPIESLGVVRATRGEIRVEDLRSRLTPKVPFPHKHDFYQIVIVDKGRGSHQIDFENYTVTNAQAFIVKPGQVHGWDLVPQTQGFVIEFTQESLSDSAKVWGKEDLTRLRMLPNCIHLKGNESFFKAIEISTRMGQEFSQRKYGFELALESFLKILLVHFIRISGEDLQSQKDSLSIVENFRRLVDENYQKHHAVEFYSKALALSPKALTMRINRAVGKSARHLIQERIVIEAKRLLVYTGLSVSEISYELGFEDPNYFVRFFREQTGAPPLKFRQSRQLKRTAVLKKSKSRS